jgi:hypothetical protein
MVAARRFYSPASFSARSACSGVVPAARPATSQAAKTERNAPPRLLLGYCTSLANLSTLAQRGMGLSGNG